MTMEVKVVDEQKIQRLEHDMLKMPQALCSVRHLFSPGLYIRELNMPAGTIAIGHAQKAPHMNIMVRGACRVLNDEGQAIEMRAPLSFIGGPGRKVGVVLEDILWLNIYPNPDDCQDIATLEARHLSKSPVFDAHPASQSYAAMLEECGVTEELVRAESESQGDQVEFPPGGYKVKIGDSKIQGKGLICTGGFEAGEVICPAVFQGKRTPAGRFTNHSDVPNAEPLRGLDGNTYWVARRAIAGCRGGQDGEEITIDYRESLALRLRSLP